MSGEQWALLALTAFFLGCAWVLGAFADSRAQFYGLRVPHAILTLSIVGLTLFLGLVLG